MRNKYFESIIEAYKDYAFRQLGNVDNIIHWAAYRYDVGEDDKLMKSFINYIRNYNNI